MSMRERTGKRPQAYSAWHRPKSIKRFLNGNEVLASRLTMIDIDGMWVEAKHPYDRPPVALTETEEISYFLQPESKHDKGIEILYQLGKAANVPVFLIVYTLDPENPGTEEFPNIYEFYVKEYYPVRSRLWKVYSPEQFAKFQVYVRQSHIRIKKNGKQLILPFDNYLTELDDSDLERRWYVHEWDKRKFAR